jgi:hypothetical protein
MSKLGAGDAVVVRAPTGIASKTADAHYRSGLANDGFRLFLPELVRANAPHNVGFFVGSGSPPTNWTTSCTGGNSDGVCSGSGGVIAVSLGCTNGAATLAASMANCAHSRAIRAASARSLGFALLSSAIFVQGLCLLCVTAHGGDGEVER